MVWRWATLALAASLLAGCAGGGGVTPVAPSTARVGGQGTTSVMLGKDFFVANDSPTISAFDEGSLSAVAQIKTVGPNVLALALSPSEQTLYAATGFEGAACFFVNSSFVTIDTASFTVTNTIPMPGTIVAMSASADGSTIAAVAHEQSGTSYVYVINASSLNLTKKIALPFNVNVNANGIAITNNATTAFVSEYNPSEIASVDLVAGTAKIFHQFVTPSDLTNVALDAGDMHLYADTLLNVPIFSTSTGTQTGDIGLGKSQQWYFDFGESSDRSTIAIVGLNASNQSDATIVATATGTILSRFLLSAVEPNAAVNGNGSEGLFYYWGSYGGGVYAYTLPVGTSIGSAMPNSGSEYTTAVVAE